MWTTLVLLSVVSVVTSATDTQQIGDDTVIVNTEDGLLRGKIATSIWNRTYHSFRAIPYAQPPIGDLRFKTPRPVERWSGVRDALDRGPYCPQSNMTRTNASMSEDCLYLNVYVPQVSVSASPKAGLSVMVWIHRGAFLTGTGNSDLFGPDNLMNHTVILVTLNYRLGALGYMFMEHPDVTSNAGMKDQVEALRWVKRNIRNFGGNPEDVTIFGQSAGGASVDLLLLSPMTDGLFHRAISESGSALLINAAANKTQDAFNLAKQLGYNDTDPDHVIKYLKSVSAEDILKAVASSSFSSSPVVDASIEEGNEVFLVDLPENLLRAGKGHQVPYITGVNTKEARMFVAGITQATYELYNKNPEMFVPSTLNLKTGSTESLQLAHNIKQFYFGNKSVSYETLSQLVDVLSDTSIIYPSYRSAMLHSNYGTAPVYMYLFTYDGILHVVPVDPSVKGPSHSDDLPYLFYLNYLPFYSNNDQLSLIRHFTSMWVDFTQASDPSLHESVKWTPATKTNHTYLQIDVELSIHQDMLKERMAFWDNVYQTYQK